MGKKLKVSEKNIIPIREYCDNFLNIPFSWRGKLTHGRLVEYAREKGTLLPRRGIFQEITKDDILRGKYYLIKDEVGKIIPYRAQTLNFDTILDELKHERKSLLQEKRERILKEQGLKDAVRGGTLRIGEIDPYIYEEDNVINNLGSVLVNNNRVKKSLRKRINH
ncbi:MAG: hypothetical protein J6O56_03650 [Bacilli bacterium]|nr:hypothetical protein [Bacilli bacterium]